MASFVGHRHDDTSSWQPANALAAPEAFEQGGDFVREGELLKVVVINRATGYVGTTHAVVTRSSAGLIDFSVGHIELRPPNLRVSVNREVLVEHGANKDAERNYVIGFEGSGLVDDQIVTIMTQWLDANGQPLPEALPGYTGRLAQVVEASEAADSVPQLPPADGEEDSTDADPVALKGACGGGTACSESTLGMFTIGPNQSTSVIRLPEAASGRAHFYLHVDPQPLHRSVDFTGAAIPDRPTFSVNEVCYSCGDYEGCEVNEELGEGRWSCIPRYTDRYGEDDRALMQRPVTYVPFLVRVFDKAATDAERQAARSRGEQAPEPVYPVGVSAGDAVFAVRPAGRSPVPNGRGGHAPGRAEYVLAAAVVGRSGGADLQPVAGRAAAVRDVRPGARAGVSARRTPARGDLVHGPDDGCDERGVPQLRRRR